MTTGTNAGGSVLTSQAGAEGGGAAGDDKVQTSGNDAAAAAGGAAGAVETPEQKAAAAKVAADKAAFEAPVDDKWAPTLKDQKLDDAALKEFRELAKKSGFKAGQAQALVEFDIARQAAADKLANETFTKTREGWREAIKKDPELGGANHDKSMRSVQRAMAKFGNTEAFKKFADGGAGDHPEFVRFVAAVGASLREDPGVVPNGKTVTSTTGGEEAELRKLFPASPELFT